MPRQRAAGEAGHVSRPARGECVSAGRGLAVVRTGLAAAGRSLCGEEAGRALAAGQDSRLHPSRYSLTRTG